jgi:hypothetical protein
METAFARGADAVWCRHIFVDAQGNWLGMAPMEAPAGLVPDAARFLAEKQRVMTPAVCVRRSIYEAVGGFRPSLRCVEDWEMWVRIAARFPVGHIREPLAFYRVHEQSNTGRNTRNAEEAEYAVAAARMFSSYFPAHEARRVARLARESVAHHALDAAKRLLQGGDRRGARAQIVAALRASRAPLILARGAANYVRTLPAISNSRGHEPGG